jgi:hypothetical protein
MKRSLVFLLFLVACATTPVTPVTPAVAPPVATATPTEPATPTTDDPLAVVEQKLRDLPWVQVRYYVETSGTMKMLARGSLSWDASKVRVDASGSLAGEQKSIRYERPIERRNDVIQSWVRIGLGHNLFRIMSGNEVEGVDATPANLKGDGAHYTFDVVIGGAKMGVAELWLDANGLPLRREQTVNFPDGDMKVTERYLWLR